MGTPASDAYVKEWNINGENAVLATRKAWRLNNAPPLPFGGGGFHSRDLHCFLLENTV